MAYVVEALENLRKNSSKRGNVTIAEGSVGVILKYFEDELSSSEIDKAFVAIFDEKNGLLPIVRALLPVKEFRGVLKTALEVLRYIVHHHKKRMAPFIKSIKDTCMICILYNIASSEKEKACLLLQEVLKAGLPASALDVVKIIDKLMEQIHFHSPQPTVLQKYYHVLGIIAHEYPECMANYANSVREMYLHELEKQFQKQENLNVSITTGCLEGLAEYMYTFQFLEDDTNLRKKFYNYLKCFSKLQSVKKVLQRAALEILYLHGVLLKDDLLGDYQWWHSLLLEWIYDNNEENSAVAAKVLDTFYRAISICIQEESDADRAKEILIFFISYFKGKMKVNISKNEREVVIKGFGVFSGNCTPYIENHDVMYMFSLMILQAQHLYSDVSLTDMDEQTAGKLSSLPSYVESIASILQNMETVSEDQMTSLRYMTVVLMQQFAASSQKFQTPIVNSLISLLYSLSTTKGMVFDDFLGIVVYHAVIRICKSENTERGKYVPLWLLLVDYKTYNKAGMNVETKRGIASVLYDSLLKTVIQLMEKLDLGIIQDAEENAVASHSGLRTVNPEDFRIFRNLVEFFVQFLPKTFPDAFEKWAQPFICCVLKESAKKPLVSGFYELLAVSLKHSEEINFFDSTETSEQNKLTNNLVCKFLQHMIPQIKYFKGDLQIACIHVFLAAPLPAVSSVLHPAVEAFQVAFRIGRSYVKLAHEALVTLQKWKNFHSLMDMRPILLAVLPELEFFLQSRGGEIYKDEELEKLEKRRGRARHKFSLARKKLVEIPDSELVQLQRQILCFLGPLSSDISLAFLSSERNTISWGHTKTLKYKISFKNMKINICLDLILPRVIDLALCCSDRQTRITACELLHAIVMFTLGTSKQIVGAGEADMAEIFQKVFMPLLQLSSDPDDIVFNLFNPLVLQLAHWYSSSFQLKSKYTNNFFNALLDGITHPTDTSLRETSARCLKEFVEWAIRQNPVVEREKSSLNIQNSVKRICLLCVHPSSAKRLGGALAFNAIYTILREDRPVIEEFWFQLLYYFVRNLSLADLRVTSEIVIEAEKSVEHVARVLRECPDAFNESNTKRHVQEFEGSTLRDAVKWLFLQCSSPQRDCRRKCMEMVCSLAPLIPGCNSVETFISTVFTSDQSLDCVLEVVECRRSKTRVVLKPSIERSVLEKSPKYIIHWLHTLMGSLDMYIWLLEKNYIGLAVLAHSDSRIISILNYYVGIVCDGKGCALDKMIEDLNMNLQDHDLYLQSRCFLYGQLFDFISGVLSIAGEDTFQYIPETFFNSSLWKLSAKCIFEPSVLGFELRNDGMNDALLFTIKKLLNHLKNIRALAVVSREASDVLRNFVQTFTLSVAQHLRKMLQTNEVTNDHKAAIQGIGVLIESGFLTFAAEESISLLQENILQQVYQSLIEESSIPVAVELQPLAHSFAQVLLQFAFLKKGQVELIVPLMMNRTLLKKPYSDSKLDHGEHFLCTFRKVLSTYLLKYPSLIINALIKEVQLNASSKPIYILNGLVQFAVENKKEIHCELQDVFSNVLEHWATLQTWGDTNSDNMIFTLIMLKHIAECASPRLGCLASHPSGQWAMKILSDKDIPLEYKCKAFDLIPNLAGSSDEHEEKLKNTLESVASCHFNKLSCDLKKGTLEYDNFVLSFRKILAGLQESFSLAVLQGIITMSVRDENHICETQIQEALPVFISKLNTEKQITAVEVVYGMFASTRGYEPAIRKNCVLRFLLPLLKACGVETVRQIFTKYVKELLNILKSPIEAPRAIHTEHNLVSRIGAWRLFEVLFLLLPTDELQSKTCPITHAAFGESDMNLIKDLTSKAHGCKSTFLSPKAKDNETILELFRQMQCAAYSTLAVIICNTKDELKFYSAFLFAENRNKNQLIWDNMIDCTKSFTFPIDFQEIPKLRKHLVSIRPKGVELIQYLSTETQILVSSTLEEDLTRFDFSNSIVQDVSSNAAQIKLRNETCTTQVVLESDELNKHECMATLCAVLNHMTKQNIYPVPKPEEKPGTLPSWMENLRKCLLDSSKHHNIHLFIVKLILNNNHIFRPYAAHWLYPIMQTVVDQVFGCDLNYMVMDVISLMISWHDIAIPIANDTEKMLASQVFEFLMNRALSSRRDVLKYNLEIIRTVVEVWKECLSIPYTVLQDQFTAEASQELGIHLAGILLMNGILPWNKTGKKHFLQVLMSLLSHKSRLLCQTSEVLGMCLKKLDPHINGNFGDNDDEVLVSSIKGKVHNLEKTTDKFLFSLHSIQKHYPPIIDGFMPVVLYQIPKVSGKFKILCLEMILARLELLQVRMHSQLEDKGLYTMLHNVDPDLQYVALLVVKKMIPLIHHEKTDVEQLLKEVLKLSNVKNLNCRIVVYEILMCAYEHNVLSEAGRGQLLEGFVDSDSGIQDLVFKFWNEKACIPSTMPNRFLSLISSLYSPHAEQHFLNYSLALILDPVTLSPECSLSIFEHPLSECEFRDLKLTEAWRHQHSSFALTSAYSLGSMQRPRLLATQRSLAFQPTVAATPSGSTFEIPSSTISSSLLVNFEANALQKYNTGSNLEPAETYFRGRRFWANKKQTSKMMAWREARKNALREELQHQRKVNRDKTVAMYRQYRIGDFPDVQISHSSLLEPMQKLAKCDVVIGRQMMVLIFSGIVEELENEKLLSFTTEVSQAFRGIFEQTCGTSMLISCVLEMALMCSNQVNLDADAVSSVCRESGSLMLGSLLLEEKLISLSGGLIRGPNNSFEDQDNCWLKLAELYQHMDQWDVVYGVFHEKLNCHEAAKLALEAEADSDWYKASKNYSDALKSDDSDNLKDYYYEGYFKCLSHLADWEKLRKCIEEQADEGLDSLWNDEWYKLNLLPYLFMSEIQLIGERNLDSTCGAPSIDFIKTLKLWLADQGKAEYIETHLTEELAVFHILDENLAKAQAYSDKCYVEFIKNWIHMSVFAFKQRYTALQNIHRFAEIQMYLNFATSNQVREKLEELLSNWKKNLPSSPCSLLNWDRRLAYRDVFIGKIEDEMKELNYVEMYLHMIDVALDNGNLNIARKYRKKVNGKIRLVHHRLHWTIGDSRLKWLIALQSPEERDKLLLMIKACSAFESYDPCKAREWNEHQQLQQAACQQMSVIAAGIWKLLKTNPESVSTLDDKTRRQFLTWTGNQSDRLEIILEAVHNCGLTYLHCSVNVSMKEANSLSLSDAEGVAKAYYKIAEYYESTYGSQSDDPAYMVAVLRAMKYGSNDSKYLFPRLLQHSELEANWMENFIKESCQVPEWMFLSWVNQIFACFDKPIGQALHDLTQRVAEVYPQAMMWAYRLSKEKYDLRAIPSKVLKRLDELLLQNTLMEQFLRAISCVVQPQTILENHIVEIIRKASVEPTDLESVQSLFQSITNSVYFYKTDNSLQGQCFQALDKYFIHLQEAQSVFSTDKTRSVNILKEIGKDLKKAVRKPGLELLSKYSPWLSEFQLSPWGDYLELPGQYTGETCPHPQYHVRIAGFDQLVRIITSLRSPIKLTIIGNNAKEYPFLVKYGEDLRQDQRIQQLFNLMNVIFQKDLQCLQRQLNIITYQVVPLTCNLGMIQWIDGTKTLKNTMDMTFTEMEKENYKTAHEQYQAWLQQRLPGCDKVDVLHRHAYRRSRQDIINGFQKRVDLIPWDIFRRAFMNMSASREEFFSRRHKFISSYATICVSHWLLGIGDRHLGNCLVRESDGYSIGIDFGYAFGCATQFQSIPELIPFRMTPHIVNLMQPFNHSGLLQRTMVHSLQALRESSQILLAAMEVFVHEPSINWVELAQKQNEILGITDASEQWLPQEKVNLAKMKCKGANPVVITAEELEAGHSKSSYLPLYLEVVKGNEHNVRSHASRENLTVNSQVDCLLDLATDPHILGLTYAGWEAWI